MRPRRYPRCNRRSRLRRRTGAVVAALLTFGAATPLETQSPARTTAAHGIGNLDPTPAATLLLPYFEVDLAGSGPQTLLTVTNSTDRPILAHTTLWTDLGRPVLDFDLYLTAFGSSHLDLTAIFLFGDVPSSEAAEGQDLPLSCAGIFPLPNLPSPLIDYIQKVHRGEPAPPGFLHSGRCAGVAHGDGVARGYLTIDAVRDCSQVFPTINGYFGDGGTAIATNANVLWGEARVVETGSLHHHSVPVVHIEAAGSIASGFWDSLDETFYPTALSNREPTPTTWLARYEDPIGMPLPEEPSDLLCWRSPEIFSPTFFTCGTTPAPFPLPAFEVVLFDDQENALVLPSEASADGEDVAICPYAAYRQRVADLPMAFSRGWIYLNLQSESQLPWQSHVHLERRLASGDSTGQPAIPLDSALQPVETAIAVAP